MMKWVKLEKYCELTGETTYSVKAKRRTGKWIEGTHWCIPADGRVWINLEEVQDMLLRLALQMARDNYETQRERQRQGIELAKRANKYAGRPTDNAMHERIAALRTSGHSIADTARLAGCSTSQVKRVTALMRAADGDKTS